MSEIAVERTKEVAEEKAKQLPEPKGFKILCMVPDLNVDRTYDGTIIKPESTVKSELDTAVASVVLFVVKLGDMAYTDEKRFPTGAWAREGDFVLCRAYSGTRFKVHGTEFRLVNDDTIEAVVQDPRGLTRI